MSFFVLRYQSELYLRVKADVSVPIPTYFTIGQNGLPEGVKGKIQMGGGQIAENLVYLGKLRRIFRIRLGY